MALHPGTRLGPYEITAQIGAGGMGEVYQASDTRLGRTVAVKVLPQHVASDPDLRARFEREARTLSRLSHPHICSIYDVGSQDGVDFLVMEFLEGETLAQRLHKGALPLERALKHAVEIADALDKAHRQGVIHRDLKPGNIMLTGSGAKLMDFGLAKLQPMTSPAGASTSIANTVSSPLTDQGSIVGTFQYMAPEQLEGREADSRSDIFAFGAVVYEMVTGNKAFEGNSPASVIGAILHTDPPPPSHVQPAVPAALDHVLKRSLEKDPEDRWQTARDLGVELLATTTPTATGDSGATGRVSRRAGVGAFFSLLILAAALLLWLLVPGRGPGRSSGAEPIQLELSPNAGTVVSSDHWAIPFALSPDGTRIVFAARSRDGARQLWLRPLAASAARPVSGTEGARMPFWSPDGEWVGFMTDDALKRIRPGGGAPEILVRGANPEPAGASWGSGDVIVFQATPTSMLSQVAAQGGAVSPATSVNAGEAEPHAWPQFLGDGTHFVYAIPPSQRILLGSLDGEPSRVLMETASLASTLAYVPGYLLFVENNALFARPFDEERLDFTGEPRRIVSGIPVSGPGRAAFAASSRVLAYWEAPVEEMAELQWFERDGTPGGIAAPAASYSGFALAPGGHRLALSRWNENGDRSIWLRDLDRGSDTRVTFDTDSLLPVWSPSGDSLVFASARGRAPDLFMRALDGSTEERHLTESPLLELPRSWSADGESLVYEVIDQANGRDLWVLHLSSGSAEPLSLNTPFDERFSALSPDNRWIAYVSNETGRDEVYVAGFPSGRGKRLASLGGGQFPLWRGRELFYVSGRSVMAVSFDARGGSLDLSTPRQLFQASRFASVGTQPFFRPYAVAADGRFLLAVDAQEEAAPPIKIVLNWTGLLEQP